MTDDTSSNTDLSQLPSSDPAQVLRFRDRQYAADLIAAALLEFDLFSFVHQTGGISFDDLCTHFGCQRRPADVLITLCRASGFLVSGDDELIRVADTGREHLVSSSQWFLGPYYKPIADSPILKSYVEILKTGKPANWQAKSDGSDWHESMKDPQFANDFTALMNCRGITFGQVLADRLQATMASQLHVLDVGGGSGIYSSTLTSRFPHLFATVLEQPPVDRIAENEIAKLGLQQKVDVASADMFDGPWTNPNPDRPPIDTVLLSNLLHDWDVAEATDILKLAAETLPVGGLLIIHGAIINEAKTGPLPVAEYSALLMNITQGKCYSVSEYAEMLRETGFESGPYQSTTGDRGFLTARRR